VADAEAQAAAVLADAEARARDEFAAAEEEARQRSGSVIAHAQTRLDKLLSAERDVHDRLVAASADLRAAISRVAGRQDSELELTVEDPLVDLSETTAWSTDEPAPRARLEVIDQRTTHIDDPADAPPDDADEPERVATAGRGSASGDDALAKMVSEAVGSALKGLKT